MDNVRNVCVLQMIFGNFTSLLVDVFNVCHFSVLSVPLNNVTHWNYA